MTADEHRLRTVQLQVCEACIERRGDECHTPGCTFWLHSVADIPAAIDLGTIVR